jgi:two-component system, chemotaxis family, chemotaxis protein CheY
MSQVTSGGSDDIYRRSFPDIFSEYLTETGSHQLPPKEENTKMKRVLVVDDSLTVARQLEKIINDSGDFTCIGLAKNGVEAIKMNHAETPDIICMDMNMPDMDGLTALRSLVALDKNVKVVMVTSLGGVGDKFSEALKLGAKSVISKPFETDDILGTLRKL